MIMVFMDLFACLFAHINVPRVLLFQSSRRADWLLRQ